MANNENTSIDLQQVAEVCCLNGAFAEVDRAQARRRADDRRTFDAFNRRFDEKWEKEHGAPPNWER